MSCGFVRAPDASGAWDAVVVGGGPAGSAAALSLARAGRRVLLVERRARQGFKLGESIPPAARPFVEKLLGPSADAVADAVAFPTHGNVSCWGSDEPVDQSFFFSPYGHGLRLDRLRFDRALRRRAEAAGATVREGASVSRIDRGADSRGTDTETATETATATATGTHTWRLEISGEVHLARFLVDCSGRSALVARHCGCRRSGEDRLFAFARVYEAGPETVRDSDTLTRVEAAADGWWYSARLPSADEESTPRRLVVFHTDRDLAAAGLAARADGFEELLAGSTHIGPLVRRHGYRASASPRGAAAGGERLDRFAGPGWIAAGDAAQAFDPLSSQGIGTALSSGFAAGTAVHQALASAQGQTRAFDRYAASQESIHAEYARSHRHFYAAEERWPERPFWSRRQVGPPAAAATPSISFAQTSP